MKLTVEVPASTSNMGPGFDAVGMALALTNTVHCETGGEGVRINVHGEGAGELPADDSNLVYRTMVAVFEECGAEPPPVQLEIHNRVPTAGGLGGSATAIVSGALLANELLGGKLGRRDELLDFVASHEGHPDNVSPCLLGGFVATSFDGRIVHALRLDPPRHLGVVLAIPALRTDTSELRAALPDTVSFADATFNVGRTALLVAAMAKGETELLGRAMQDRIHEHVRTARVPGFDQVRDAALREGALACCLSGAGATVIAYTDTRRRCDDAIGEAMVAAFQGAGVAARAIVTEPRSAGARLR